MLDEVREKVIELFDYYSLITSEAKYKTNHGEGIKLFNPKQMLERLAIDLSQIKEICQIIYSLY